MNTNIRAFCLLVAWLLLGAVNTALAVWPFGESDSSKAAKLVEQGNARVVSADEAWRGGNTNQAEALYREAADIYQQADQLSPNMKNGLIRLRTSYCVGQIELIQSAAREKAKPALPVAVTHPPRTPSRGSSPGASSEAETAPVVEPVDVRRELALAQRFIMGARPDDAAGSLVKVLRVDSTNRNALLLMAVVRVQQGRYEDAVLTIEGLRIDGDEDVDVLMIASGAYCGAGRYFDALLALDKVLKIKPDSQQAYHNMAYLVLEMSPEKRGDAQAYYQAALKFGAPRDALLEKRLGMKP